MLFCAFNNCAKSRTLTCILLLVYVCNCLSCPGFTPITKRIYTFKIKKINWSCFCGKMDYISVEFNGGLIITVCYKPLIPINQFSDYHYTFDWYENCDHCRDRQITWDCLYVKKGKSYYRWRTKPTWSKWFLLTITRIQFLQIHVVS